MNLADSIIYVALGICLVDGIVDFVDILDFVDLVDSSILGSGSV